MRRCSRILCSFGLIELLVAIGLFYLLIHLPFPYGTATLPGGLSDVGDNKFDEAVSWQAHEFAAVFGVGIAGAIFLVVGVSLYGISRWIFRKSPIA